MAFFKKCQADFFVDINRYAVFMVTVHALEELYSVVEVSAFKVRSFLLGGICIHRLISFLSISRLTMPQGQYSYVIIKENIG